MESVKTTLAGMLSKEFGRGCVMELDTADRCMKIELPVSSDHVIYVRPDTYEKHFICHYAHKDDLLDLLCDPNGETLEWKQQNVAQLPRMVKGTMRDFVPAAMWYVRQAAERIEMTKGLGGRRVSPILETFREAKTRGYNFPEPKKVEAAIVDEIEENNNRRKRHRK